MKRYKMKIPLLICWLVLSYSAQTVLAHSAHKTNSDRSAEVGINKKALSEINEAYLATVKPIFERSCLDCHSSQTRFPWYSKLPFVASLIEHDISEAREHVDMTDDFPFSGHGSPKEDLVAIQETIDQENMPPRRYRWLHAGSELSEAERKTILTWVTQSLMKLSSTQNEEENREH